MLAPCYIPFIYCRRVFMNRSFTTRDIATVAMGVALIGVCSWVSIPMTIPFTMQTFAVCLVTALFGLRRGMWTVLCYILLGAAGVPVFSGFKGGIGALLGTTGGYIVGFLFTALIVGLAVETRGRRLPVLIGSMVVGVLVCYALFMPEIPVPSALVRRSAGVCCPICCRTLSKSHLQVF